MDVFDLSLRKKFVSEILVDVFIMGGSEILGNGFMVGGFIVGELLEDGINEGGFTMGGLVFIVFVASVLALDGLLGLRSCAVSIVGVVFGLVLA